MTSATPADFFFFLVNGLAVYRLVRLIAEDRVTQGLRDKVALSDKIPAGMQYLITCPYCLSVYFAAFATAGHYLFPLLWNPVAYGLALSALVCIYQETIRRHDDYDQE